MIKLLKIVVLFNDLVKMNFIIKKKVDDFSSNAKLKYGKPYLYEGEVYAVIS